MAGRGTDIKLGGNKDYSEDGIVNDVNEFKKNESKVKDLGGLFIKAPNGMKVDVLIIN